MCQLLDRDGTEIADKGSIAKPRRRSKGYFKVDLQGGPDMELDTRIRPLIDDKYGYLVLGRSSSLHSKWNRKGLLEIGAVGEHQTSGEDLFGRKVFIDAAFPHILFICGKRGSGKSYTLGIFAEELIRSSIGVGVILVDPIGIFWSLKMENQNKGERETLEDWNLSPTSFPEVKVLAPGLEDDELPMNCDGHFSISVGEMAPEDWCQLFDMDRFKTQGLLVGTVVEMVRKGYSALVDDVEVDIPGKETIYSISDLIHCIENSSVLTSKTGGFNPQTRRSVIARFQAASSWGLFSIEGTPLRELTSPNRVTVLDISDPNIGDAKRSLLTGIMARKILEGRIYSARQEEGEGIDDSDPDIIPLTWLLIDEAHVILPHGKQTAATRALVEYAKQGRRPGCALVLATQRPASTSDEILSQVDMLIGHNLALEDDMTALRRRVPAKLPAEFASSDFIRAIPVGTAIIADQRTQQRSFMLRLRPRLSYHAGSSAMPTAFMDPKKKKRKQKKKVSDKKVVAPVDEIREPHSDTASDLPYSNIPWGSTILLKGKAREDLEELLGEMKGKKGVILFTRAHPSNFNMPEENNASSFWLSSTPGEGTIPPKNLQDIPMEADAIASDEENWAIVIDGIEFLFHNNDASDVQRLLEILHEKVFLGKHMLIIRADQTIEEEHLDTLKMEMDHVIGDQALAEEPEQGPLNEANGSLSGSDLKWMCDVMGIPTEGSETDMLDRIVKHELDEGREVDMIGDQSYIIKEMIKESARMRDENEELRKKMEDLAKALEEKKKEKGKKLIIEWEGPEEEEKVGALLDEISNLKEKMDDMVEKQPEERDSDIFEEVARKIEDERKVNLEKLKDLEESVYGEIEIIKDSMELPTATNVTDRKRKLKKRVVKEGSSLSVILPKVGTPVIIANAKKRLKRSLFKGPRESIEDLRPMYLPLYRVLVSYRPMLSRKMREADIFIDTITGEVVSLGRGGLRRSIGLHDLLKATPQEKRILRTLLRSPKDEITLSRKLDMELASTKRSLTSLIKKGLLEKGSSQGGATVYTIRSGMDIPRRPWTRDPGFRPEEVKGVREDQLSPIIKEKDLGSILTIYGETITLIDNDTVHYPVYLATIRGEGRTRYLFLDGVTGGVDEVLTDNAKLILRTMSKVKEARK